MITNFLNDIQTDTIRDFEEFQKISHEILFEIARDKEGLKNLIQESSQNQKLFSYSEHYDILDKLVLFVSEDREIRLRLHIFADDYFDRPHNHRWSYSSYILSGGYKHTLFEPKHESKTISLQDLTPRMIRHEKQGDLYTLHHSQHHSVVAKPNTITLVFRGPSEKKKFQVMDRATGASWWQYGADFEKEEEKKEKRMTEDRFKYLLDKLRITEIL